MLYSPFSDTEMSVFAAKFYNPLPRFQLGMTVRISLNGPDWEKTVRKIHLVAAIAAWALAASPALADHNSAGYKNFNVPTAAMFAGHTPMTQAIAPPPLPPSPPPVLPQAVNAGTILMPRSSTILPTDTLSVRSPIKGEVHPANTPPPNLAAAALPTGWDRWDKRFDFRDEGWILFSENFYTDKYGVIHHHKADEKPNAVGRFPVEKRTAAEAYEAAAEFDDMISSKHLVQGSFVPTSTTHVTKLSDTGLQLSKGAVLVMSPARSIKVFTSIGGSTCVALRGKSIAMVSVYDDKLAVVNLTDGCCGSVEVTFPKDAKREVLAVQSGQVLELYHDAQSPSTNLVATRVLLSERLTEHHCCMVCQLNYIRALKKYQLEVLPKKELSRVLKTAAAMVSLGR